jgi:hypothetical protein
MRQYGMFYLVEYMYGVYMDIGERGHLTSLASERVASHKYGRVSKSSTS